MGCTRTTALLAPANNDRPYHDNFEFHRRRFQEICGVLNPAGVRLAVGFQAAEYRRRSQAFQFIHDLDALMLLLNMVSAPNLGLLLDAWEVVAAGGSAEVLRKLSAEEIVAVHVAEMPDGLPLAELDENSRLLPGVPNGRVDVAAFLAVLKQMGYDGPVTVRPSRSVFQSRRRDVIVKQTAEALNKVWPTAGLPAAAASLAADRSPTRTAIPSGHTEGTGTPAGRNDQRAKPGRYAAGVSPSDDVSRRYFRR